MSKDKFEAKNPVSDEKVKEVVSKIRKIVEKLDLNENYKIATFSSLLLRELLLMEERAALAPRVAKTAGKKAEEVKYMKKSSAWYLSKLINETDFFEEKKVRTTIEIIERMWLKFRKKIRAKDASRDFSILVRNGELDKDFIPRCRRFPRGMYVWFLPGTLRQEIERYKEQFK